MDDSDFLVLKFILSNKRTIERLLIFLIILYSKSQNSSNFKAVALFFRTLRPPYERRCTMNYVELRAGVEPAIYSLQVNCLTIRLSKHKVELFRTSTNPIFYKWGYDLIYYCNYILAGHRGLEPRTHGLTVHRSAD